MQFRAPTTPLMVPVADDGLLPYRYRFLSDHATRTHSIVELLKCTPLVEELKDKSSRFGTRRHGLRPDAVICSDDLVEFVEFVQANKGALETQLNCEIRADVAQKPIQQLNRVLRLIGMRLVKLRTRKDEGRKVYFYQLDAEALATMERVIERRAAQGGWAFLASHYGWTDEGDLDEDGRRHGWD